LGRQDRGQDRSFFGGAGYGFKVRLLTFETVNFEEGCAVANEAKALRDLAGSLQNLQNTIDGTVGETIPQKLERPWKSFLKTNEDVIDRVYHILEFLEKNKEAEFDGKMQEDFEIAKKKWQATNNVYGGLVTVMEQCKTAMECWDRVEKNLKKL
jgi:hypothetical protein